MTTTLPARQSADSRAIRPAQVGFPPLLKQVQATLKAHDLQPGRYVLPQMIITPVG